MATSKKFSNIRYNIFLPNFNQAASRGGGILFIPAEPELVFGPFHEAGDIFPVGHRDQDGYEKGKDDHARVMFPGDEKDDERERRTANHG